MTGTGAGTSAAAPSGAIDLVTETRCQIGESPVWDERRQELFWCDIPAGRIWRHAPGSGRTASIDLEGSVGSLGLCESGRLIVACALTIRILDPDTGRTDVLHRLDDPGFPCRLNDGRVGPDGAFWAGTVHDVALGQMEPLAALWRFTASRADEILGGLKCSNGLAFTEDGRWMHHSDSVGPWVRRHAFDLATGRIGAGEVICTPGETEGRPDGGAFDIDGLYWSAGVSAGVLNAFDATGGLVHRIALPVPHPTMPCFGGADFRTLYITSHRNNLDGVPAEAERLSGRLFSMRMTRPGFAAPRFDDRGLG